MRHEAIAASVERLLPPSLALPLKGGEDYSELAATPNSTSPSPLEGEGWGGGYRQQSINVGVIA